MKSFDHSRFQHAFEQPPRAFHHTVEQALEQIRPARMRLPSRRRVAVLAAVMLVCLIGAAAAVLYSATLGDFLNINLKERGVPVVSRFAVQGDMALVDVQVREAAADGMSMYLTVAYSLKDEDGALAFGRDMEYVMDPVRAQQTLPNHLDIPAAKSARTLYWLTTDSFSCKDSQGVDRDSWSAFSLYESPSTVVVMYWFDLRATDAFDSFIEPEPAAFPDSLIVSIAPQLYVYRPGAQAGVPENPDSYVCLADFAPADAGELQISVSPQRNAAQTHYQIADFPEELSQMRVVSATVTETPLLYCLRLDFQWMEGHPLTECRMYVDLLDAAGEPMEYLFLGDRARVEANGPGDVDFRVESVYPKQDGRTPQTLVITPAWAGSSTAPIAVQWALRPVE